MKSLWSHGENDSTATVGPRKGIAGQAKTFFSRSASTRKWRGRTSKNAPREPRINAGAAAGGLACNVIRDVNMDTGHRWASLTLPRAVRRPRSPRGEPAVSRSGGPCGPPEGAQATEPRGGALRRDGPTRRQRAARWFPRRLRPGGHPRRAQRGPAGLIRAGPTRRPGAQRTAAATGRGLDAPAFRAHRRAHTPPPAGSLATGPQRQRSAGRKRRACQTGGAPATTDWRATCRPGSSAMLPTTNHKARPPPASFSGPHSQTPSGFFCALLI